MSRIGVWVGVGMIEVPGAKEKEICAQEGEKRRVPLAGGGRAGIGSASMRRGQRRCLSNLELGPNV